MYGLNRICVVFIFVLIRCFSGQPPPLTQTDEPLGPGPTNEGQHTSEGPGSTDSPGPGPTNEIPPQTDGPGPTDGPKPNEEKPPQTDGPGPTDGPKPTEEKPPQTDGPGPTDGPKPTEEKPPQTDGPGPTDGPKPTEEKPPQTDGPGPTDGPKPTEEEPPQTDGPGLTDGPKPTEEKPLQTDGPGPTDGPKPTEEEPAQTDGPVPTDGPKPTEEKPPQTDGPVPTGGPKPTEEKPPQTDGPVPTDGPKPTEAKPTQTDGPVPTDGPKPTEEKPPQTDGPVPTDGPKPTEEKPPQTDGPVPTDGPKPTEEKPPQTDGPVPTDGPKPTEEKPPQTDGPVPTDSPKPTEEKPPQTDGPVPTDGPKPTEEKPPQTDGPGPTDGPKPTEEKPPQTDGPGPTNGPKPTEENPPQTDGPGPTNGPKPTEEKPPQTDGLGPTNGPKPTEEKTSQTDGPGPTNGPGPTEEKPPQTDGPGPTNSPKPTEERPSQTDGIGPTNGPKPTEEKPTQTDGPEPTDNPDSRLICGTVPEVEFGVVVVTEIDVSADVVCNLGYIAIKKRIKCLQSGQWDQSECLEVDCRPLQPPKNGTVQLPDVTSYNSVATFACFEGFSLVGDSNRTCIANGNWNGLTPDCVEEVKKVTTCPENTDGKGRVWAEVVVGKTRIHHCDVGFTGNITRYCRISGRWASPVNNCVRRKIQDVEENAANLGSNSTENDVNDILEDITDVSMPNETMTDDDLLTEGELDVLADTLEKVVETVVTTNISADVVNENITNDVIETASNLIDDTNQDSWKILKNKGKRGGGEKLMGAVDSMGSALCSTLEKTGRNKKTVVKRNVAFEVRKVSESDVLFPETEDLEQTVDDEWLRTTKSKIRLRSASLKGKVDPCSITTVMYRNMSDVLSSQTSAFNDSLDEEIVTSERINAPILAMSISPPVTGKIDPPVRITFEHADDSLANPVCAFWLFQTDSQGYWSTEGCVVNYTTVNYTICECDHLTNFAILMSPFIEADASSQALRIISILGISVSITCLLVTCVVHMVLWRHVRSDATTRLMNLCIALLSSYIIFLAGVDRTESSAICTVIAAILQYIYLVVFCVMLVEGVEMAVTLLVVFKTKSRTRVLLILAWVIPLVIVGISLGITHLEGYGNEDFCWLSVSNGVIWAFVGPALFIIFINVICLIIVMRTMFRTTAVQSKKASEKIRTSLWSLCVLVPIMGLSWLLGIFYVNDSFYFIQYLFSILNGLQGFFIFLFHCVLNKQVRNAFKLQARKRSATNFSTNTTSKDDHKKKSKDKSGSFDNNTTETRDTGHDRKSKILQESFPQVPVQVGSSVGMFNTGTLKRSAPFSTDSRDKLINGSVST